MGILPLPLQKPICIGVLDGRGHLSEDMIMKEHFNLWEYLRPLPSPGKYMDHWYISVLVVVS